MVGGGFLGFWYKEILHGFFLSIRRGPAHALSFVRGSWNLLPWKTTLEGAGRALSAAISLAKVVL